MRESRSLGHNRKDHADEVRERRDRGTYQNFPHFLLGQLAGLVEVSEGIENAEDQQAESQVHVLREGNVITLILICVCATGQRRKEREEQKRRKKEKVDI